MKFNIDFNNRKLNGIYIIKSLIDDRFYIGSATNLYKRFGRHLSQLRKNDHFNIKLQNFYNKYGEENLSFELIKIVKESKNLKLIENLYIKYKKPTFNIAKDAFSMFHIPKEIRSKNSQKLRGIPLTKEHKDNVSKALKELYSKTDHHNKNKKYDKERRRKMSDAQEKRVLAGNNKMINKVKC